MLTLIADENAPNLSGLVADFIRGGIGSLRDFAAGDESVPITIRSVKKQNGVYVDTWQSGDSLTIAFGYTNLSRAVLTTALPSAAVTATLIQSATSSLNQTYGISFTAGTYGGFYSISATVGAVSHVCGNVSPLATTQQVLAVLLNHPSLTTGNVTVSQDGDSYVIEFIGNLSGPTAPTITVTDVSLTAPLGVTGTLTVNTDEMVAAFSATGANYIDMPCGIRRLRGSETLAIFNGTQRVWRSVVASGGATPIPPVISNLYLLDGVDGNTYRLVSNNGILGLETVT